MLDGANVRAANRRFYDLAADVYEAADGRRGEHLPAWLMTILEKLHKGSPRGPFLEIGCGSGWLLNGAAAYYQERYGCDLSMLILRHAREQGAGAVCAEAESLPFAGSTFAVVVLFATLHHVFDWRPVMFEAYRVLQPGGLVYCDHDLSSEFLNRFRPAISMYRAIRRPAAQYTRACADITESLYKMAEFHEDTGVSWREMERLLTDAGFCDIESEGHWMGVNRWIDALGRLLGVTHAPGRAPLLRIIARKPGQYETGASGKDQ